MKPEHVYLGGCFKFWVDVNQLLTLAEARLGTTICTGWLRVLRATTTIKNVEQAHALRGEGRND